MRTSDPARTRNASSRGESARSSASDAVDFSSVGLYRSTSSRPNALPQVDQCATSPGRQADVEADTSQLVATACALPPRSARDCHPYRRGRRSRASRPRRRHGSVRWPDRAAFRRATWLSDMPAYRSLDHNHQAGRTATSSRSTRDVSPASGSAGPVGMAAFPAPTLKRASRH